MKKNLTVEDVKARVEEIKKNTKAMRGDPNAVFGLMSQEHILLSDVLKAISKEKCDDPKELAKEVLKIAKSR